MGSSPVGVTISAPPLRPSGGAFSCPQHAGGALRAAAFLLVAPLAAELLAALGFAVGLSIGPWHLLVTLALAAAATVGAGALDGAPLRRSLAAVAFGAAALAASAFVAARCWDLSYDGQAYHASAVALLARGWNPLAGPTPPGATVHGLWIEHYLRGPELAAATLYAATGSLEAGKAFGFGLALAAALVAACALRRLGAPRPLAVAGAALAAGNPVALAQLATFYVDGQVALLFTCAVALAVLALRGSVRSAWPLLGATLALLAQVKFTATGYAALLLLGVGVAGLRVAPARAAILRAAALTGAVAAATLAIAWQPLVTNARDHGHPFHPLAGPGRRDVLTAQAPRFPVPGTGARFLLSTFSESSAGREAPVPKWPFVVRARELDAMVEADPRVGGFGPLFALGVVLSVAGLAAALGRRSGGWAAGALLAAAVLATAAVNPGAWWARYVPQVWLGVVVLALALTAAPLRPARLLAFAALLALSADALLVGAALARHQRRTQAAAEAQLRELARLGPEIGLERGEMETLPLRFAAAGLRASFRERCDHPVPLVGVDARACLDGVPAAP